MHRGEPVIFAARDLPGLDGCCFRSSNGRSGGRSDCAAGHFEPWSERKHRHDRDEHGPADDDPRTVDALDCDPDNGSSDDSRYDEQQHPRDPDFTRHYCDPWDSGDSGSQRIEHYQYDSRNPASMCRVWCGGNFPNPLQHPERNSRGGAGYDS
jgi:hypothetical protein